MVDVNAVLDYARAQLGKPYVFGAAGPSTFDCSGLVTYVFSHFGITLPHHSEDQAGYGTSVPYNQIQAGDLVFSDWGDGPNSHVGIATGDNRIINAPQPGYNVEYDDLNSTYRSHLTAVRRVTGLTGVATFPGGESGGSDLTSLLGQFIKPVQDIATGFGQEAQLAGTLSKAFLPTNAIRIASGITGFIFVMVGIFFLLREVR